MRFNLRKEILHILLLIVPLVYLSVIYNTLPGRIATHFDIHGRINSWNSKGSLWFIPAALPLLIYLILLVLPIIDPKQSIKADNGKYKHIRLIMVLFTSAICCFTLYLSQKNDTAHPDRFLFALLGLFFAAIGSFFPALKPNYFIGVRTPWTLESEISWKKTHQLASKLWIAGGLLIAIQPFILQNYLRIQQIQIIILIIICFVPVIYSFFIWRRQKTKDL